MIIQYNWNADITEVYRRLSETPKEACAGANNGAGADARSTPQSPAGPPAVEP